jgi:hypothetical protein
VRHLQSGSGVMVSLMLDAAPAEPTWLAL